MLRPGGEARILVYNRRSLSLLAVVRSSGKGIRQRQLLQERSMEGVLSRGVERSSIGARPLVRVYSPASSRR